MKQSLQRKINAYRQAKTTKQSFQTFIEEKKKNLKAVLQKQAIDQSSDHIINAQYQNKYTLTDDFTKKLELKQQQYFRQIQELQKIKLQIIQKNNNLENLKIQMNFQGKGYQNLVEVVKQQKKQEEALIEKIVEKQAKEIKDTKKIYEQRLKKNFEHYEQLLSQKSQQNQRRMQFVQKKKKFQKNMKQAKQNYQKALKENKKLWQEQQQSHRQKWQKQKKQEITQNTLKGIEPEIQRIIESSKSQIKKIQEKYDILREQYRHQRVTEYQKKAKQMRDESFAIVETEKTKILTQYSQKLKQRFYQLQQQFQQDRKKIRAQREHQIKQLEEKRKNQTQEFIFKNKDFYSVHLKEVKEIKEQYEAQIRELDGKYQLQIEKEEDQSRIKFNEKLQKERQAKRKQLEVKIKAFTVAYEKQSQSMYEDLVEKVAVSNDLYESQVRARTQQRLKEARQSFQAETKKLKKTIQILQGKILSIQKQIAGKIFERESTEQELQEIRRQNQYLILKQSDYQKQIMAKKVSMENNVGGQNHPQVKAIKQQWQEQINCASQAYATLQEETQHLEEIMAEKIAELRNNYSQTINQLQKNSLKLLNLKKNELSKLKVDKEMQQKYNQSLDQMILKQKAMIQKYQQQQKSLNMNKKPFAPK